MPHKLPKLCFPARPPAAPKIWLIHATWVAVQPMMAAFREHASAVQQLHSLGDAFVLAQISMARALVDAPAYGKPVLTSPETSIRGILSRLSSATA